MKLIKVAVTGGIGSGKSLVLNIINSLGYKTVSLDEVYAQLLQDEKFVLKISSAIGVEPLYIEKKAVLNRKAISEKVFSNKKLLETLNLVTHSAIFERAFSLYDEGIVFFEVPLLFEGGYQNKFDFVFVVQRDLEKRILSAMVRDGATREQIEQKIKNQFNYDDADLSIHTIINNDLDEEHLKKVVVKAIENIKVK